MAKHDKNSHLTAEVVILIVVVFVVGFAVGFLASRLKYKTDLAEANFLLTKQVNQTNLMQETQALRALNNGAMMNSGHMYVVKDGGLDWMNSPIFLTNGAKVNVDGSVINTDGSKISLIEGQGIDSKGNLIVVYNPQQQ